MARRNVVVEELLEELVDVLCCSLRSSLKLRDCGIPRLNGIRNIL